ncbi:PROM2 isoform 3 [Pan troglodytes]|uniref:PROM2 isoform 1 n=2 Tax=Pan troglodytes TaxID=9598 RepID=A0A6D2WRR6_PANTR|nr:prominin-2 isoform X1 [Pan troglodytes]XP_016804420.1 prominin-2 isoform X1 [Pan troglodytes]PNI12931.1 PROM2 isoform 1 [Pan troglodytes]PNI12932.1 PROM2 isoform 2 [Pan troglodytes]PNI12933.1 PROM2 isoform 3 [Pan troglodytes]
MKHALALLAPLLGLGLGLALSRLAAGATDCKFLGPAEHLTFTPAARARWLAPRVHAPGLLDSLYGTVRRFLSVVQLNPFPSELVKALLNELASVKVNEVVRYEAGYVVCAVIAGLYLLLVPTAGLCFCCCRCHRRCGGRVKTEHKALACERAALMVFLLLTTLLLLIGVVCAFVTNQRTHEQMGPSIEAMPETLLSLRGLVSDVPQELQAVAQQFSLPQEQVSEELDGVGVSIGSAIHTQLRSSVYPLLAAVGSLGQVLQVSVHHLQTLNATVVELQAGQQDLEPAIREHRDRLLELLQEAGCQGDCAGALSRARTLELGADFSQVPSVDHVLHQLKGVPEANFSSMVQEENSTFNALPALAAMQTSSVVQELKKAVAQQPEGVRTLAEGFPGLEAASHWAQALQEVEESSRPYLQEVQRYETYRWIVGCVLCSVVLFVVLCNLLGLNLGIWGLSAREDPSHPEAKGEAGARFLMAGVGLSFLFAAPLILLVFATFLVGGNVQTLVCRSWENGELFEFADTPGNLPLSMNLSQLLGLRKNISIHQAYQQCKEGAALWTVLQLNDSYDLEEHLDINQYTNKLRQELQSLKVDTQSLDLLSSAARRDLEALQSSGLQRIHYPDFLVQIQRPVVKTSMEQLAQELQGLAQAQDNSVLGQRLQEEAQGLRNLHQEKVVPQQSLVAKLNLSVRALESSAPNLQLETSDVLANVTYLKGELPAWAARILRNVSECFLAREMGYFSQYVAWVREEVTQRIATCQPLSGALDNSRVILCDMMADPWNAFWFCLAWCTFFLIPSIIFAVKTSKYFRPIRKRLSSTSSEETQLFHIPRVTSLKL